MKRIFIDADKCDGCMNCTLACMNAHRKDGKEDIYTLDLNDAESESRCFIRLGAEKSYKPVFCRHCDEPMCVTSCMSGAMSKDPETGIVAYDEKKCGACRPAEAGRRDTPKGYQMRFLPRPRGRPRLRQGVPERGHTRRGGALA